MISVIIIVYFICSVNLINAQVPIRGCDLITSDDKCFIYRTHSRIDWASARLNCQRWGGDLASIKSPIENAAMNSITPAGYGECWIGLNDLDSEGTFVWSDGNNSSYRNWYPSQPDNSQNQDCVVTDTSSTFRWKDHLCNGNLKCYYCSIDNSILHGNKKPDSAAYEGLSDNAILYENTTLFCITEKMNTPHVSWTYVDLAGNRTVLNSTTDVITGVSVLSVTTDQPGYYSCQVTRNANSVTYTVGIFDLSEYTEFSDIDNAVRQEIRYYTKEIDTADISIFCNNAANSIPLTDIKWRRDGESTVFPNPLRIISYSNQLQSSNNAMHCINTETDTSLLDIRLTVQGPPTISLNNGSDNSFSLLPPDINSAAVTVLTQNVVLTTNLAGRWQRPDNTSIPSNTLHFTTFTLALEGMYKFYVNNWDGQDTLAIQIYITVIVDHLFGIKHGAYSGIPNNYIFYQDTTLYCLTENIITPHVTWSYVDLAGKRTVLNSTTDETTGVSVLSVTTDQPGYYSCQVTQNAANVTYTTGIFDIAYHTEFNSGEEVTQRSYTIGVDRVTLFCNSHDSSIPLSDIKWRLEGDSRTFLNPLIPENSMLSTSGNNYSIQCTDIRTNTTILNTVYSVQGPPIITLYNGSDNSFSLLPPDINSAVVTVLTQNVVLTTNLAGSWQRPDNTSILSSTLNFTTMNLTQGGVYKFYVKNWNGQDTLAIQINISLVGIFEQRVTNLRTETSSSSSILVSWNLLRNQTTNSDEKFAVYYGFGDIEIFAGTTSSLMYNITGLVPNVNYTIIVEMTYALSTQPFSEKTFHLLKVVDSSFLFTSLTSQKPACIISISFLSILLFALAIFLNIIFCFWLSRRKSHVINPKENGHEDPEKVHQKTGNDESYINEAKTHEETSDLPK